MDDGFSLTGQIDTRLSLDPLTAALISQRIQAEIRESCHYEGSQYIRIYFGDVDFRLERTSGEFLAHADANTSAQLLEAAGFVSAALIRLDLSHRFEVYGAANEMVGYLNHRWPIDSQTALGA